MRRKRQDFVKHWFTALVVVIKRRNKMKTHLIILGILCLSVSLFSQAWITNIEKKNPSFFDIRDAFYRHIKGKNLKDVNGWKQFKRWEWFWQSRVDAKGYFDAMKLWEAIKEKKQRFRIAGQSVSSNWTELGPVQVPGANISIGVAGLGRINCITFDPNNLNIIWVGSPSGGLWKSTNGGSTWSTSTDNLPNIGISWIVIDPNNTNIMYLATGDGDAGDTYCIGVLKSTDGGNNWNTTGLQPGVSSYWRMRKLLMHPTNSNTLLAAVNLGIYKTTNGGTSWTNKKSGDFKDIEVNPSNPSIWYAAAYRDGIYKSIDSGDTWNKLTNGLPTSGFARMEIAISNSSPSTLYAVYCDDIDYKFYGLYRSTDSGSTWTLQSNTPNILGYDYLGNDTRGFGWYTLTIEVNPTNPNEVYVGTINIWKSTDGGAAWNCIAHWYGGGGIAPVHADTHYLAFKPGSDSVLICGNDGGFYKSQDSGATWTDLSNGLAIHQIYRQGCSAQFAGKVIIGCQDNGTELLDSGSWYYVYGGDGMECAIDPRDSNTMYCEYINGDIQRSVDNGQTWTSISPGVIGDGAWVTPYLLDPNDNNTLYFGTSYVYKSTNQGSSWSTISNYLSSDKLRSLAVAPSNSNYIYAADQYTIFKTSDSGANWTTLQGGGVPTFPITYIAVHPDNPNTLWVTRGGYTSGKKVYYSTNGGQNWSNISGSLPNIPVNCVVVDSTSPNTDKPVYVGTDLEVYYSRDGKGNWQAFDTGLPNVIVNELEIHTATKRIRAATYGRGLWESLLAGVTLDIQLQASRAVERAFIIKKGYGKLQVTVDNKGQIPIANYEILRSEGGGQSQPVGTIQPANIQYGVPYTYYDKYLEIGKSYTYVIYAYDANGALIAVSNMSSI